MKRTDPIFICDYGLWPEEKHEFVEWERTIGHYYISIAMFNNDDGKAVVNVFYGPNRILNYKTDLSQGQISDIIKAAIKEHVQQDREIEEWALSEDF